MSSWGGTESFEFSDQISVDIAGGAFGGGGGGGGHWDSSGNSGGGGGGLVYLIWGPGVTDSYDSPHTLTMDATSDNQWSNDGTTWSNLLSAASGGFDIAGDNGLYFGTWASNVEFGDNAATELDWYAGYASEFENGMTYDVGYLSYTYPGEDSLDF